MLKNANDTVPLSAKPRRLELIGPLADAAIEMRGPWWGAGEFGPHVDVLGGLRSNLPNTEIRHAAGVAINDGDESGITAAVDRKSTRLNSSHSCATRMPSSA